MAAADELVRQLAATEHGPLCEDSPVLILARVGALALMTRIKLDGAP